MVSIEPLQVSLQKMYNQGKMSYLSSLTDKEWEIIEPLLPKEARKNNFPIIFLILSHYLAFAIQNLGTYFCECP